MTIVKELDALHVNGEEYKFPAGEGDMKYSDFSLVTKSGATITLDLFSEIEPSENFTINAPSEIKEGQMYILRVTTGATPYTMTLGTGITNPYNESTTLTANTVHQFGFLAVDGNLELQPSVTQSGGGTWGTITGTLSDQTDLQTALNAKADASDLNTKTFILSSTSDLTNAQAAYDWYAAGKNPIIMYNGTAYIVTPNDGFPQALNFSPASLYTNRDSSKTMSGILSLQIFHSGDTVTSIQTGAAGINILETDRNYSTPYTPRYNGSPATKKYVDDSVKTYTAGTGLTLSGTEFSADTTVLATKQDLANMGSYELVATLPSASTADTKKIYLLGPIGESADRYEEWVCVDQIGHFESQSEITHEIINFDGSASIIWNDSKSVTHVYLGINNLSMTDGQLMVDDRDSSGAEKYLLPNSTMPFIYQSSDSTPYEANEPVIYNREKNSGGSFDLYYSDSELTWVPAGKYWKKVGETSSDTKTFYLTGTTGADNLATAQAAYNYWRSGGNPIVYWYVDDGTSGCYLCDWTYREQYPDEGLYLLRTSGSSAYQYGYAYLGLQRIHIDVDLQGQVTEIEHSSSEIPFLATNNQKAYTPSANYHPATKKYVDDRAVPTSGTTGYILTKTANGYEWAAAPSSGKNDIIVSGAAPSDHTVLWLYNDPKGCEDSELRFYNPKLGEWTPFVGTYAGSSAPDSYNALWYNTNEREFYIYNNDDSSWQPIGSVIIKDSAPSSENKFWYDSSNNKMNYYDYDSGSWQSVGGVIRGDSAPSSGDKLWYDTDEDYELKFYENQNGTWIPFWGIINKDHVRNPIPGNFFATDSSNRTFYYESGFGWNPIGGIIYADSSTNVPTDKLWYDENNDVFKYYNNSTDAWEEVTKIYTAGDGIDIDANNNNAISVDVTDIIGTGLSEDANNNIIVDTTVIATKTDLNGKQDKATSGSTAPSTTPTYVGQQYVDTTNNKLYVATGTTSSSDWTEVGSGGSGGGGNVIAMTQAEYNALTIEEKNDGKLRIITDAPTEDISVDWSNVANKKVDLSTQTGNLSELKFWIGTTTAYQNLDSYDNNTVYICKKVIS